MRTRHLITAAALLITGGIVVALRLGAPPTPALPFESMSRPIAPNYADPATWAALPLPDAHDNADVVPAGETLGEAQITAEADAFYIHPTTYAGAENWNQDLAQAGVNAVTDSAVAAQASMFNACCQVYAPRYRQATLAADTQNDDNGRKAEDLAYQDVKRAFLYYANHFHHERPFVLAAHGQGARHALRLLQEVIDGTPLAQRLVAAYVTGIAVSRGMFGAELKTLAPCAAANDLGCIVNWTLASRTARTMVKDTQSGDILCMNPLTFDASHPAAPATANVGALMAPGSDALPELKRGATGASCQSDGLLHVEIRVDTRTLPSVQDTTLFYRNIRANAALRVQTFLQLGGGV